MINTALQISPSALPVIVEPDFHPFWRVGESDKDYHANRDAVGSTSIKYSAKNSEASFYEYYVNGVDKDSKSKRLGRLTHKAVLEPITFWNEHLVEPSFGDKRNKANKAEHDAWHEKNAGKIIVTSEELRQIKGMCASLKEHEDANEMLMYGINEVSGYYRDPSTGILCKIRPDIRHEGIGLIADLKTCESVREEDFTRSIDEWGYHASLAMYGQGTKEITGVDIDMYVLIAVQKNPPYEVAVYVMEKETIAHGMRRIRVGLDKLAVCLRTNTWPKYQEKFKRINLPKWKLEGF